ncbi:DUF368 domain-containing protein [Streptococcus cristatus]|uniref:DUF368 domain-containing protein n=1 Tax=Streptococcus cristatus TaxID=45634 RepID=A0A5B0DDN4_STRCR|nr:DUF368 domain-containing protein [Streptococcus cristatus]KAA0964698.1 DUF368 domain-containing protein [Streptococcus cristatus]
MPTLKKLLFLGNFQEQDIFYHFESGKLYSYSYKPDKVWDIKWAVLASGLVLTNLLSSIGFLTFTNFFVKYGLLISMIFAIVVLAEWALRLKHDQELMSFNPRNYFGWSDFIKKCKHNLLFLLLTGIVFSVMTFQFLLTYLQEANLYNYILFSLFFPVSYFSTFKVRPIKRFFMLKKLSEEVSNGYHI